MTSRRFIARLMMITTAALLLQGSSCPQLDSRTGNPSGQEIPCLTGSADCVPGALTVTARADKPTAALGETISLRGSASGGTPPYQYSWQRIEGPAQFILHATDSSGTATLTGTSAGITVMRLTATDSVGASANAEVLVYVISSR